MIDIEARLGELRSLGLNRRMRLVSGPQGPHVLLDGKPVLLLCSDNCLGFADNPAVRQAAADAATRWGAGAGSSRLVAGTMTIHRRLEERLAAFHGRDTALVFGSGYLANAGCIAALARQGEVVFSDDRNQPSIVDGCRLSGAEVFVYDHCDVEHLRWGIEQAEGRGALIVTESVFRDHGDIAPLEAIVELAQRFGLRTVIDEGHAAGVLGPGGRGALAEAQLEDQVDLIVGTLGNALGSYGAFVACDRALAHHLVNSARTFIFSTALPPPAAAAALAALDLLRDRPHRVRKLLTNATVLRDELAHEGFDVAGSRTQIVALPIGDPETTMQIFEAALSTGVFAQAIRPPAVAPSASGLRLAVMATHQEEELRAAAQALAAVARAAGFDPRAGLASARAGAGTPSAPAVAPVEPAARRESEEAVGSPPAPGGVFDFEAAEPVRRAA
ncbi:MAG TPA: 8-amino-7-oxononanoate synthase [Solirubrobacteraceae bacterium]|nr:8-amino-7-oxononanoate synthase [Solirubrobacteraceae bacterium]